MILLSQSPSRPTRDLRPPELAVLREVLRPLIATNKLRKLQNDFVRGALFATLVSSVIWLLILYEAGLKS